MMSLGKSFVINVVDRGALADGVSDSTQSIQNALLEVPEEGGTILFPAGTYLITKTLWVKSRTAVIGYGGRSKVSVIRRADGMYDDLFCAGIYTNVRDHTRSGSADWAGGLPFTKENPGNAISMQGVYIDGNNRNAGQNPKVPGNYNSYRGSNIWIQYVDGVYIKDVWSDYAPNDGAFVSGRHITVVDSIFSNTKIFNRTPGSYPTNNGITIAGTLAPIDGDVNDMITIDNVQAFDNDDLGVSVQAREMDNADMLHGGTVICSNILTKGNRTYGIAIEAGQDSENRVNMRPLKKVIMSNIISENDGRGRLYSIGIKYDIEDVIVTNMIVNSANNGGLVINGHNRIKLDTIHIRNYAVNPDPEGPTTICGLHVYCDAMFDSIDRVSIKNVLVTGGEGRTRNTEGINVTSSINNIELENVEVEGTTWLDERGIGISLSSINVVMTNCKSSRCGDDGVKIAPTVRRFRLNNIESFNNGQSAHAPSKRGFNLLGGDGTIPLRVGDLVNCWAYDDQPFPTQQEGIFIPTPSRFDSFRIAFCRAWGNASRDFRGTVTGSMHAVWGNIWGDQGADNAFRLEGSGGTWNQNLLAIGPYHLFIDNGGEGKYIKFRISNGKPTSGNDGVLLPHVSFGRAVPAFAPFYAGQKHIDTDNGRIFEAVGDRGPEDFRQLAQTGSQNMPYFYNISVGSPHSWRNQNTFPVDVVVRGGNVSKLEFKRGSGTQYVDLAITNGIVRLAPLDYIRITFVSAPSITIIPQ